MPNMREKVFSVTIADCRVDTFTVGGHGGAGKDTSNTGVRIVHEPSGAKGECQEQRSQLTNKQTAFRRMAETKAFKAWVRKVMAELATGKTLEQHVEEMMEPQHLKVEGRNERGAWVVID